MKYTTEKVLLITSTVTPVTENSFNFFISRLSRPKQIHHTLTDALRTGRWFWLIKLLIYI